MLGQVMDIFDQRLHQCMDNNGKHLTDVIFKAK